jgi:hypothetical protein
MTVSAMELQLVGSVQESLGLLLYENARFLSERLVAQFASEVGRRSRDVGATQLLLRPR